MQPDISYISRRSMSHDVSIGSDPEFFLTDSYNGRDMYHPAFKVLPTEEKRHANEGFADGFQAEITPCADRCLEIFTTNLRNEIYALQSKVNVWHCYLNNLDVVHIDPTNYAAQHLTLGCSPSLNAYDEPSLITKDLGLTLPFRSAGCHIHLGFNKENLKADYSIEEHVKFLDLISGPVHTLIAHGQDTRRRLYYGRAGEYRIKPYGFEYRVPSPRILNNPLTWHVAADFVKYASVLYLTAHSTAYDMSNIKPVKTWLDSVQHSQDMAREIINTSNVQLAGKAFDASREFYLAILAGLYKYKYANKVYDTIAAWPKPAEPFLKAWDITGPFTNPPSIKTEICNL